MSMSSDSLRQDGLSDWHEPQNHHNNYDKSHGWFCIGHAQLSISEELMTSQLYYNVEWKISLDLSFSEKSFPDP